MRHFVSLRDPAGEAELRQWLAAGPEHLGPVVSRHTVPTASTPLIAVVVVTGLFVVALLVAGLVGVAAWGLPVAVVIFGAACGVLPALVVVPLVLMSAGSRTIEVRRHGLVVASRPVPFATMDPGRMVWATSASAARAVVTLNRRRRVAGGDCLLLSGTDGADAVDDWQGLGTKYDPLATAPRLDTPFVWWVLGPKDVGALVRDLETAMVADGYPVHGLAARLGSHRVDVPSGREAFPRRAPHDPVLWRA